MIERPPMPKQPKRHSAASVQPACLSETSAGERRSKRQRLPPEERRKEIVRRATSFFAEHGFDASTRELAAELGITQPLLYRYFPSKDDLVREVYQTVYLSRWRAGWDDLLCDRSRPLRERLQDFYDAYTDAIFTREWIRIYLFAGLKGIEINKRYLELVETRILRRIITEFRREAGLPEKRKPLRTELELAWVLQGGIFYYGVRKHIYAEPVLENKSRFIAHALEVFFEGVSQALNPTKHKTTRRRNADQPVAKRPGKVRKAVSKRNGRRS